MTKFMTKIAVALSIGSAIAMTAPAHADRWDHDGGGRWEHRDHDGRGGDGRGWDRGGGGWDRGGRGDRDEYRGYRGYGYGYGPRGYYEPSYYYGPPRGYYGDGYADLDLLRRVRV